MFNSICATDLKQKVAQNVNASMKTNAKEGEVHVTGPFKNAKSSKNHWVAVYGDNGQSWLLKAQFISGYIEYSPSQVKRSSINIGHCKKYYEINIFVNMNLGKKIVGGIVQAGKGSQVKLSTEFLLCIHVTQRKSSLENKVFLRQLGSSFYQ